MSPKIHYIEDDNTDRDFPSAIECEGAEFKVNGEYLCVEPCGGGGKHLLGDQYIHVEKWGSDSYVEEGEEARIGTVDDPFLTIERALVYISTIVTINGMLFIIIGDGTFTISNPIFINHPNRIEFVGKDYQSDRIILSDSAAVNDKAFWYGGDAVFHWYEGWESFDISIPANSVYFGDTTVDRGFTMCCSDGTTGIVHSGNVDASIEKFVFGIQSNSTAYGNATEKRYYSSGCCDGTYGLFAGGITTSYTATMDTKLMSNDADSLHYGDLTISRGGPVSASDGIYAIFAGGSSSNTDITERCTVAILDSVVEWGNLLGIRTDSSICSDRTTGVIMGGFPTGNPVTMMEEINIINPLTTSYFGDTTTTTTTKTKRGAVSDGTTGIFYISSISSVVEQIVISIKANSTNFAEFRAGATVQSMQSACSGH